MNSRDVRALSDTDLTEELEKARRCLADLEARIDEARDRDALGGSWHIDRIEQNRPAAERAVTVLADELERRRRTPDERTC